MVRLTEKKCKELFPTISYNAIMELRDKFKHMRRRSHDREACELKFKDVIEWIHWAVANGWYPQSYVCRIGDTGNYEPGNIRFASAQSNTEEYHAKPFDIMTPWGEVVHVECAERFAREEGLDSRQLRRIATGGRKSWHGWTLP